MKGILTIFFISLFCGYSQGPNYNDSIVTIKGQVIDTNYRVGSFNVVILNKSTGRGVFGNYNGSFSIDAKKSDVIGISIHGYKTIYVSYADSAYHRVYRDNFYAQELAYQAQEVIVRPIKSLEELKEERAAIEKRKLPEVTAVNAISSPITALYVAFSKREKTKRMVAEMEYKDKQDDIVREILRVYVHNDIFDLSEGDFDEFIRFLNLEPQFLMTANDIELVLYIRARFNQFQKIKEGY